MNIYYFFADDLVHTSQSSSQLEWVRTTPETSRNGPSVTRAVRCARDGLSIYYETRRSIKKIPRAIISAAGIHAYIYKANCPRQSTSTFVLHAHFYSRQVHLREVHLS